VSRLLIVAYPKISKPDHEWIQDHRRKYDELSYQAVPPHFTLFFRSFPPLNLRAMIFSKSQSTILALFLLSNSPCEAQ
jgi:hypothetical protein